MKVFKGIIFIIFLILSTVLVIPMMILIADATLDSDESVLLKMFKDI